MLVGAFTGQSATVFPNQWRGASSEKALEVKSGFPQAFDKAEKSLGLSGIACISAQVSSNADTVAQPNSAN